MALKLNERYPGRFNNPTAEYPQGSFKNRTSPTTKDGSYLEQDWANDKEGFFQSLLSSASIEASGAVDKVGGSQYFSALNAIVAALISHSAPVVGTSRNARISIPAASASATFTADEVYVKNPTTNIGECVRSVNKTVNLGTVGAGGMDSGAAPANDYVSVYLIFNPTTQASALLACAQATSNGPVYTGPNMPAGYTMSALVSSWRTASSQFVIGYQEGRSVSIEQTTALNTAVAKPSFTSLSIAGIVPLNAKTVVGWCGVTGSVAADLRINVAASLGGIAGSQTHVIGATNADSAFRETPLITPQTIFYRVTVSTGTITSGAISINGYSF